MDHLAHTDAAAAEITEFADLVRGADPELPVPTCPGWNLGWLVVHVGGGHRWATKMVRELAPKRVRFRDVALDLPPDPADHPDWLLAGRDELVSVLRAADPDAPMWAWGADHHARFWSRRMVYETLVHRMDAVYALGKEPYVDPALAADGIDEFLDNLAPAVSFSPGVAQLTGSGETLHLHATDAPAASLPGDHGDVASSPQPHTGEWLIRLGPEGFTWSHGHGKGDVALRGSVQDLFLFVWGRRRVDDGGFDVFGDRALLDRWVANSTI